VRFVPLKLTVPLTDIPAGEYTFQVTVLDTTDQKVASWQAPVFLVGN
jgi:hypothetical protein